MNMKMEIRVMPLQAKECQRLPGSWEKHQKLGERHQKLGEKHRRDFSFLAL